MDAHTGALLAMASYPTYDPSWFAGGISARHTCRAPAPEANDPLVERAIAGEYPTGSTFKVVDTIAGLETGVLSPTTTLDAGATYTNHGLLWHDWNPNGHGVIDLKQALVQSADTYFYQVGYDFYLRARQRARKLGRAAGLRAPHRHRHPRRGRRSRAHARLAPPAYTKKTDPSNWRIDSLWKPGNSINLAIGQGDLLATPLQMAVSYAAIANGGYLVTPHLGLRIDSPQGALAAATCR